MRRIRRVGASEDDPLSGVANLFDLGVILALAFMVPLIASMAALSQDRSSSASQHAEARLSKPMPLEHFEPTNEPLSGEGERLGVAYRLKSGEVVYVPEKVSAPSQKEAGRTPVTDKQE